MKRLITALLLSVTMIAYGPLVTITNAQAAVDTKMSELKKKANQEIDRRLASLKKTEEKLEKAIKLEKEALSDAMSRVGMTGVDIENTLKNVSLDDTVKKQSKDAVTAIINKLTELKKSVNAATTVKELQDIAKSIDSQYRLDQAANAQGAVTKAVESLTAVFDKMKSTANDVQTRVTKLRSCATNGGNAEEKERECSKGKFAMKDKDAADAAQTQLDNAAKMLSSIGSVIMSAVTLLAALVTSFSGILGKLGDLSNLGDVSNQSSLGGLNGLMSSLTGISAQLDIASGMSGNAQTIVTDVAGAMNTFDL